MSPVTVAEPFYQIPFLRERQHPFWCDDKGHGYPAKTGFFEVCFMLTARINQSLINLFVPLILLSSFSATDPGLGAKNKENHTQLLPSCSLQSKWGIRYNYNQCAEC